MATPAQIVRGAAFEHLCGREWLSAHGM